MVLVMMGLGVGGGLVGTSRTGSLSIFRRLDTPTAYTDADEVFAALTFASSDCVNSSNKVAFAPVTF